MDIPMSGGVPVSVTCSLNEDQVTCDAADPFCFWEAGSSVCVEHVAAGGAPGTAAGGAATGGAATGGETAACSTNLHEMACLTPGLGCTWNPVVSVCEDQVTGGAAADMPADCDFSDDMSCNADPGCYWDLMADPPACYVDVPPS